jgi:hypothetical protein
LLRNENGTDSDGISAGGGDQISKKFFNSTARSHGMQGTYASGPMDETISDELKTLFDYI